MQVGGYKKVFAQAVGVLGMIVLYSTVARRLVPGGINGSFLVNLEITAFPVFAIVLLAVIYYRFRFSKWPDFVPGQTGKLDIVPADALLVLIPMTPVLQYVLLNHDVLDLLGVSTFVALGLIASLISCFAVPLLFSWLFSARVLMLASLALVYVVFNMASYASHFKWHNKGEFWIQFSILVAVMGVLFLVHLSNRKTAHLFAVIALVATIASNLPGDPEKTPVSAQETVADKASRELESIRFKRKVNVYYLTYESYGAPQAIEAYGIDSDEQMKWLRENGFVVHPGAYSLASTSLHSISRLFAINAQLNKNMREYIAGDNKVHRTFRNNGYRTHGIFPRDYLIQDTELRYDEYFPERPKSDPRDQLILSVAKGEFRHDVSLAWTNYDEFLDRKRDVISHGGPPRFVYAHNSLPDHSQNSGRCMQDEVARYEARLRSADLEMRTDVEKVLAADPDAIVVLAGDHGPYMTENCAALEDEPVHAADIERIDIQDRLGVLLAIRWPAWAKQDPCEIRVLQDVFPVIFSQLAEDRSLLRFRPDAPSRGHGVGGIQVDGGRIVGGPDDGEPLFESGCPL